jgi:aminomethyltransferase
MADNAEVTEDAVFGGRVRIRQPARGYRVNVDTLLLAAAVETASGARLMEAGCGVGAALLALAVRNPGVTLLGVERDADIAALARENVAANAMSGRIDIATGDALDRKADWGVFDSVYVNPPFDGVGEGRSPAPHRLHAHVSDAPIDHWIAALADRLTGGAALTLIHRAARLPPILAALEGRLGGVEVIPIRPRADEPAKRVIVRARTSKFADFAGYDMPIQFEGLIAEHNWTRTHAGLFDVSHMGPCFFALPKGHGLKGDEAHRQAAALIERLAPADIQGLKAGQVRYTTLLNQDGGILDDLMIARPAEAAAAGDLYIVVNAGSKHEDWKLIEAATAGEAILVRADDRALLALQGPSAAAVAKVVIASELDDMTFMTVQRLETGRFGRLTVTRSGYTGEDGYEILVRAEHARDLAEALLAHAEVKPVGLGARDSLRLEAGLCLYGHDLDATTSPIEADLAWTIQKRRREAKDFPGAKRILREYDIGPSRKRVGIRPNDRAPAREGVEVHKDGKRIGVITSGGFSPILNAPISMGYVEARFAEPGVELDLIVRGQARPATVVALPFVPHRYVRKRKAA